MAWNVLPHEVGIVAGHRRACALAGSYRVLPISSWCLQPSSNLGTAAERPYLVLEQLAQGSTSFIFMRAGRPPIKDPILDLGLLEVSAGK
jgi:hypothetical protein